MKKKKIVVIFIFFTHILVSSIIFSDVFNPYKAKISSYFTYINRPNSISLNNFLTNIPKGAELHQHLSGAAYPKWLISYAKNDKLMLNWCVHAPNYEVVIDTNCRKNRGILLRSLSRGTSVYNAIVSAWSMKNFPLISPEYGHDHFFGIFPKISILVRYYQPQILADLMHQAVQEHISYLELMIPVDTASDFLKKNYLKNIAVFQNDPKLLTYKDIVSTIFRLEQNNFTKNIVKRSTITNAKHLLSKAKILLGCTKSHPPKACNVLVKFQSEAHRFYPLPQVFFDLYTGFKAAKLAPNLFVGVNLIGQEDDKIALNDYNIHMLLIRYMQRYFKHSINVSLHAGELSDRLLEIKKHPFYLTNHINKAINIAKAKRIGHGLDIFSELAYHPNLIQDMKNHFNSVEINLTSNEQILGVCDGKSYCMPPVAQYKLPRRYKFNHPFYFYLTSGVPIVLSTDDQGIEQTDLIKEYYKAVRRYALTYQQLKNIDRNSLKFSFLPGQQLWATIDDYIHFVVPCVHDNPYAKSPLSKTCRIYLNSNLKARLEWNLEKQFAKFERKQLKA